MRLIRLSRASLLAALLGLVFSGAVVGCSDDDDDSSTDGTTTEDPATEDPSTEDPSTEDPTTEDPTTEDPTTEDPTEDTGAIRVVHLSPDGPGVDIFVDGAASGIADLPFGSTTAYVDLPAGTYDFDVIPAGGEIGDTVLTIGGQPIDADMSYTAIAYDAVASIQALAIVDDLSAPADGDMRVRAIHVAKDVGEVDIWNITDPENATPLYENVPFGAAGDALDIPAGGYVLGFDVDDDAVPDVQFALPSLPAGTIANLYAVNDAEGNLWILPQLESSEGDLVAGGIMAEAFVAAGPTADVRIAHFSPDAPAVDIFLDDTLATEGLEFPTGTEALPVEAGTYSVGIAASGDDVGDAVLVVDDVEFMEGMSYTAYAFNTLDSLEAAVLVDDVSDIEPTEVRIRAIHAAVGVGQVDIWNITDPENPEPFFTDLDFGGASDTIDLALAIYDVGLDLDEDQVPDLCANVPAAAGAGLLVNLFAYTDDNGDAFLGAQVNDAILPIELSAEACTAPAANASVRVIHLAPDVSEVDVFVAGVLSGITNLAFQAGTDYVELPAGAYDIDVALTGDPIENAAIDVDGLQLDEGVSYSVAAIGTIGDGNLQALPLVDNTPEDVAAGTIHLRAIHAAPAVGQVDIWDVTDGENPMMIAENVDFGAATDFLPLPADTPIAIGLDVDDNAMPDLVFNVPGLAEGTVVNAYANNNGEGTASIQAHFDDGSVVPILPNAM